MKSTNKYQTNTYNFICSQVIFKDYKNVICTYLLMVFKYLKKTDLYVVWYKIFLSKQKSTGRRRELVRIKIV